MPDGRFARSSVIARYALAALMRSRFTLALLLACLVPNIVLLVASHLRHNVPAVEEVGDAFDLLAFWQTWIMDTVLGVTQAVTFLVVLVAGPGLVSPDIANNAMPLYLSRPVTRLAYIGGKLLALMGLAVAVGLLPGLLVLAVDTGYAGNAAASARLAAAFAAAVLAWTFCLSLIALAISAWVRWRPLATLGFLGLYVVASGLGDALEPVFGGLSRSFLDLGDTVQAVAATLSGVGTPSVPFGFACAMIAVTAAAAATVLFRRVRA